MRSPGRSLRFGEMRDEVKQALRGLADERWPAQKLAHPAQEPPDYFLDISNALHSIEDVARPSEAHVGVSLADTREAELVDAVFDAWAAVEAEVGPDGQGASDAVFYAAKRWPLVMRAAQAAYDRMDANDRRGD